MPEFEWDNAKAEANYRKHGISFELATEVFDDVYGIETLDPLSPEYREERVRITGKVAELYLTVIYTERDERIRIISARRATKSEHDDYYRQKPKE